jgi:hypothetical protein
VTPEPGKEISERNILYYAPQTATTTIITNRINVIIDSL